MSDGSESTVFWYYMKHSCIYLLVPVLFLRSVRLCIKCFRTIAGQKLQKVMLHYIRLLALLSITLKVSWQLILVSYNAKVIQPPCCNSFFKGAYSALHKWLYWEFGVSTILFVVLRSTLDICLTCCGTILYLIIIPSKCFA